MTAKTYWKAALHTGWDHWTGNTVNYRDAIGSTVSVSSSHRRQPAKTCSGSVLHAAVDFPWILRYAPMAWSSFFEVTGRPVTGVDGGKVGFRQLRVIREVPVEEIRNLMTSGALQDANLRGAVLQDADLRGADLRYANLQNVNLRYADLRWANLRYANLGGAQLQYANLRGADLQSADLRDAVR